MSRAPALMLPLGTQPAVLYQSKCVDMTLKEKTSLVRITAHGRDSLDASAGCAISGIIESAGTLLKRGQEYKVIWDLRDSPLPGFANTARLAAWGISHKAELESLTTKMGVIVPQGPVASVAAGVLAAFSGVPTKVGSNAAEIENFV
jgi:hypothetical protein